MDESNLPDEEQRRQLGELLGREAYNGAGDTTESERRQQFVQALGLHLATSRDHDASDAGCLTGSPMGSSVSCASLSPWSGSPMQKVKAFGSRAAALVDTSQ